MFGNKTENNRRSVRDDLDIMEIKTLRIKRAHDFGKSIVFDIVINNNMIIYGMRLVETKEGEIFVSMPQRKDDDKYYPIIICNLDDKTQKGIITAVKEFFEEK